MASKLLVSNYTENMIETGIPNEAKSSDPKGVCSYVTMDSPVGTLTLVANEQALVAVLWEDEDPDRVRLGELRKDDAHPVLREAKRQLRDYFAGKNTKFNINLEFHGTVFQKKVWQALVEIPFGETRSYADIARRIDNPKAVRAVGAANGKNPISIIARCRRVDGSN